MDLIKYKEKEILRSELSDDTVLFFIIHDNGGRCFYVKITKKEIIIKTPLSIFKYIKNQGYKLEDKIIFNLLEKYENFKKERDNDYFEDHFYNYNMKQLNGNLEFAKYFDSDLLNTILKIDDYIGFFPGYDTNCFVKHHGGTVLIHTKLFEYMEINKSIFTFQTNKEIINSYTTNTGNSDVHYSFALSKNYIYLMIENACILKKTLFNDISSINIYTDVYSHFYGHSKNKYNIAGNDYGSLIKKLEQKIIKKKKDFRKTKQY